MREFIIYYLATYSITMFCTVLIPSKHPEKVWPILIGSILVSMFGFLIWPLAIVALFKRRWK